MFGRKPLYQRRAVQAARNARKLLKRRADLVEPEEAAKAEGALDDLKRALGSGSPCEIETHTAAVDVAAKLLWLPGDGQILRSGGAIILSLVLILFGVRAYFVHRFTIPTSSMAPVLRGIATVPSSEPAPSLFTQAIDLLLRGRTYIDVVAGEDCFIAGTFEAHPPGLGFVPFLETTMVRTRSPVGSREGRSYSISAPKRAVDELLRLAGKTNFRAGEPIVRGYVDPGDSILVDKFTYHFRKPKRDDLVVFATQNLAAISQPGQPSQVYVKRIAGVPGDELRIDPPVLFVNGNRALEPGMAAVMSGTAESPNDGFAGYSNYPEGSRTPFRLLGSAQAMFQVPPGAYFTLGDNSLRSVDSRAYGPVPQANVLGRAFFIYRPWLPHAGFTR